MKKLALIAVSLVLTLALVIGMAISASAQDDEDRIIIIHKTIPEGGPAELFTFKVYRDYAPWGIITEADELVGDVVIDTAISNTGSIGVPWLGKYIIHEELGAGSAYQQPADETTFVAGPGCPPGEVTFDNQLKVNESGTMLDIQASPTMVYPGETVMLTITEENTGNVDITDPHVILTPPGVTLDELSPEFVGGDIDGDGELDVGELWEWQVTVNPIATTKYTAVGHGFDPLGNDITNPPYEEEEGSVEVEVTGDATRTPGFWKTHYDFTKHIFNEHLGGTINLGWKTLNSEGDVFGMFWASKARDSDGNKRDKLCQSRVTTSFQALAAILNTGLDNGATLPVSLADIATILAGADIKAIKALGETLDVYNNSGDDVDIVDDCPYPVLPADPNAAGEAADITIADC
jgi:uncharacterized repeat protein (TIGR01451 family)